MTHVQIPDIKPEVTYIGDGVQTQFTYPFPIFRDSDIRIYFNNVMQNGDYTVNGEGDTNGGYVNFISPPPLNVVITIQRYLPVERTTDFTNSGKYSASSLNDEFDYLTACVQQVDIKSDKSLLFPTMESGTSIRLPAKSIRANKLMSFDADGNPTVTEMSEDGAKIMSTDTFVANGFSAVERTLMDKNKDFISVKDFGAKGDGITDDTNAIKSAINEAKSVFFPVGTYNINSTIEIKSGQFIFGSGNASVIQAIGHTFDVFQVIEDGSIIKDLKIVNGLAGIRMYGKDSPCVQNNVENVIIESADMGIVLDGYLSTSNPCYWNSFRNVLISRPKTHGVLLTLTGGGDTPNANKFHNLRVYSHGEDTQGYGIYLQNANYYNSFIDTEVNIYDGANACIRVGDAELTNFINLYTETIGAIDNIILDEESKNTSIINHLSMSAGGAIVDNSGGSYSAINAGYPNKNKLQRSKCDDLTADLMRYNIIYLDYQEASTYNIDLSTSFYLVSSYNGQQYMILPKASTDNDGAEITIKKSDFSKNPIIVKEDNGSGPDGREIKLAARYDFVTVVSNGANWWIKSANSFPRSDQYYDGVSKITPSMSSPLCLVSAYNGNVEVELPPADNVNALGQTIMIKKTDSSINTVTITENGGAGPDNSSKVLANQYDFTTVISNGGSWYVVG